MHRIRRHLPLVCLLTLLFGGAPALAQFVEDVSPVEPENGQTVGPRPTFRIGIEGEDLYKMRFKIVLSQDDFETEAYVFDQMEEKNGWAFENWEGGYGAMYRTRKPIADGEYEWKVHAWNGLDWVAGDDTSWVNIDGVLPAEVSLMMEKVGQGEDAAVRIFWDPVYLDARGESEDVAQYHVYRFNRKRTVYVRMFEIGVTPDTYFDDEGADEEPKIVFYRVTAEDLAGNHPTLRIRHESEVGGIQHKGLNREAAKLATKPRPQKDKR
jgi:hypothetical protein